MSEAKKHILVIGLGSMGKRRIRLLMERDDVIVCGVDGQAERCKEVEEKFGVATYASIDDALCQELIDCAFVCTSPLSHADIIHTCLENNWHVFTEINLVSDRYGENIELAKEKGKVLFLSSTFLYRKEQEYIIKTSQEIGGKLNYNYHVGQYLPDWHPWESYNNYFIGDRRTNGCREIMAIDMPWLVTAFGKITNVQVLMGKNTELNVNYNDNYLMLVEHESGAKGMFAVDVVARKAVRHFEMYGEQVYLTWNGTPDSLIQYDIEAKQESRISFEDASEHQEGYAAFISENPYREEIKAFFECVEGKNAAKWSFEKDIHVLQTIDKIES